MSDTTKSNYHYHRESGSSAVKEHLRAFQQAKMERIVRANAGTPAGAGIRRQSASSASKSEAAKSSDEAPLVPKKAPWTTEERWQGDGKDSAVGPAGVDELGNRNATTIATEEVREDNESMGEQSEKKKKKTLGNEAMKVLFGWEDKPDKHAMYPI